MTTDPEVLGGVPYTAAVSGCWWQPWSTWSPTAWPSRRSRPTSLLEG